MLPTDSLFITFQCIQVTDNDLADRWWVITRQEGGVAASMVCLQALPLSLPSPRDFITLSRNREPAHRLLLHVVKSRHACKSKRFQITRYMCKFYSVCKFLSCSCYEHEQYTPKFLLSYIQRYLRLPIFCCTFCGNFWKALKNIAVFEFQSLFYIGHRARRLHKYKNIFDSSNDRLDTKILSQISKLQDKNHLLAFLTICWFFYRRKTGLKLSVA